MPRGIPSVRNSPLEEAYEDESEQAFEQTALEAAEDITAHFMQQHPPPDGERRLQKRHLTYWKMCGDPNCRISGHRARQGWIVIDIASGGPFGPEQVVNYAKAIHGTNLENALGKPGGWAANSIAMNEAGLLWDSYDEEFPWGPFTHLFMAPGGVSMMPIDQFCQLGFHRDPVLSRHRKAELANVKWWICDMCPEGKAEYIAEGHLEQHRMAEHKEHVSALAAARENAKVMREFVGPQAGNSDLMNRYNQLADELTALRGLLAENLKD